MWCHSKTRRHDLESRSPRPRERKWIASVPAAASSFVRPIIAITTVFPEPVAILQPKCRRRIRPRHGISHATCRSGITVRS